MRVAAVKRFRAWLLLATFVASLGSSQLSVGHLGIIDTACGEVGLATADSAQMSTATNAESQHCPVCHFLRAVSGASTASVARLAVQEGLPVAFATTTQVTPVVDSITPPSRGPPTLIPSTVL